MQPISIPLILLGYLLAAASSTQIVPFSDSSDNQISNSINSLQQQQQQQIQPPQPQQQQQLIPYIPFQKRPSERYGFGLGRRGFTYTSGNSGVKRLPVYNFGLGKRSGRDGNAADTSAYGGDKR